MQHLSLLQLQGVSIPLLPKVREELQRMESLGQSMNQQNGAKAL